MRDRAAVVPEAFFRVFELPADDVDKGIDFHDHSRLERIQIVHGNQPRRQCAERDVAVEEDVLVIELQAGAGREDRGGHVDSERNRHRVRLADRRDDLPDLR